MRIIWVANINTCKFSSILVRIFFYLHNYFPTIGNVEWDFKRLSIYQINEFINGLGDKFERVMDEYFNQIPLKLVDQCRDEICFLVDIDTTLIKVVEPRIVWLETMEYELDIDRATRSIKVLLDQSKDLK